MTKRLTKKLIEIGNGMRKSLNRGLMKRGYCDVFDSDAIFTIFHVNKDDVMVAMAKDDTRGHLGILLRKFGRPLTPSDLLNARTAFSPGDLFLNFGKDLNTILHVMNILKAAAVSLGWSEKKEREGHLTPGLEFLKKKLMAEAIHDENTWEDLLVGMPKESSSATAFALGELATDLLELEDDDYSQRFAMGGFAATRRVFGQFAEHYDISYSEKEKRFYVNER